MTLYCRKAAHNIFNTKKLVFKKGWYNCHLIDPTFSFNLSLERCLLQDWRRSSFPHLLTFDDVTTLKTTSEKSWQQVSSTQTFDDPTDGCDVSDCSWYIEQKQRKKQELFSLFSLFHSYFFFFPISLSFSSCYIFTS